jgi:hypothetical protein
MSTEPERPDPLLQSLADDANALPAAAAAHARESCRARGAARRAASMLAVFLVLAAGIWWAARDRIESPGGAEIAHSNPSRQPPVRLPSEGFVKVQHADEPYAAVIPPGAGEDERRLLAALEGVPAVLVRDASGRITRVHVIDR